MDGARSRSLRPAKTIASLSGRMSTSSTATLSLVFVGVSEILQQPAPPILDLTDSFANIFVE